MQALRHSAGNHFSVIPIPVDADKQSRAIAATPAVESGRVFLPLNARWLADFTDELSSFPSAPHDDITDAFSQAVNYLEANVGWNFLGSGYPGRPQQNINYRAHLLEFHGNYAAAALAMKMPTAEFQKRVEAQADSNEWFTDYESGVNEWSRQLYGTTSDTAIRSRPASWDVPVAPRFTIGWPRR